jgi:REP element-mobilizing transposase RayT
MARQLRITYEGAVYHVTARGNEQRAIVRDDRDRQEWRRTLAQMVEHYRVVCHAWVLMDNHYHLLLETPTPNLSRAVRHLNGVYTQRFNRRHQRVGHLFQGRFKALLVEREAYLLELCRYLVLNPVRAHMVRYPGDWAWSSYRATAGEEAAPTWLHTEGILTQFGRTGSAARAAYRRFVAEGITHPSHPWTGVRAQIYLGSDAFVEQVVARRTKPDHPDIPRAQQRPTCLSVDACLLRIARAYQVEVPALLQPTRRPSEARQVALYAARRVAGAALGDVAHRFGLSYSGVSRRVTAVDARLQSDPRWQTRVAALLDVKYKT